MEGVEIFRVGRFVLGVYKGKFVHEVEFGCLGFLDYSETL
jgi:hypothetical protein